MRIVKKPEERKAEIVNAASHLFLTKGYEQTSVADINKMVGIAKGTFYYYFESKDQLLDEIIMLHTLDAQAFGEEIANTPDLSAIEKLQLFIIGEQQATDDLTPIVQEMHKQPNGEMHIRSLVQSTLKLSPVLAKIVKQGIDEGVFHNKYPDEIAEMLLVVGQFLFDRGLFNWTKAEIAQKAQAYVYLLETVTGAEKGVFDFLIEQFSRETKY